MALSLSAVLVLCGCSDSWDGWQKGETCFELVGPKGQYFTYMNLHGLTLIVRSVESGDLVGWEKEDYLEVDDKFCKVKDNELLELSES